MQNSILKIQRHLFRFLFCFCWWSSLNCFFFKLQSSTKTLNHAQPCKQNEKIEWIYFTGIFITFNQLLFNYFEVHNVQCTNKFKSKCITLYYTHKTWLRLFVLLLFIYTLMMQSQVCDTNLNKLLHWLRVNVEITKLGVLLYAEVVCNLKLHS